MVAFKTLLAPLAFFAASAKALSVARDGYAPPITSPTTGDVWTRGESRNITWDVTNAPPDIYRYADVLIAQGGTVTTLVLARAIDPLFGGVQVLVPWLLTRDNYAIALVLNDTISLSAEFTIRE